jgi:hypothetical protein
MGSMAILLLSFKLENGKVGVVHGFFGRTQGEAEMAMAQHAEICPKFGPAYRADETVEFPVDVESIPEGDGDAIEEWLEEFQGEGGAEEDPEE